MLLYLIKASEKVGLHNEKKKMQKRSGCLMASNFIWQTTYHPRFKSENMAKNKLIYDRIESLAKRHHSTPPQLALAWVLHQGNDVVPIPGE